ncbi:MAG: gamma-glutamyl-gamma-aminobutyrate hydrolase family protein [Pirellulales bacterium]
MTCKPRIGLNADFLPESSDRPAHSVIAAGYYDCILRAGGLPIIIPPIKDEDDLYTLLQSVQGFVLVGGRDLDPRNDGFMLHPTVRPMPGRREAFDRLLVKMLYDLRLPTFGIGVGMQLMNLVAGGNLFLHIPEDLPRAVPHKDPQDPAHRHALAVEPGTIMERVYGDGEIRVNSMHHMALDEIAGDFKVSARCPDGVVEAIESVREDWFALGTQFHPEAESASALDIRIFEEFIDGVVRTYAAEPLQRAALA